MDWTSIAAQLPVVALVLAFVIYWSDRNDKAQAARDKAFREFLSEQRNNDREILGKLVAAVERMEGNLNDHDQKTDVAIAEMKERTRPRPAARGKP